ncbi:hypothetical protein NP493_573g00024 [Ridgeia piscesae]|uniref:Uncharacterized protein n=1 Tax=Ridgeia piscesae TaxID=27915 RepID=A0AAD9KV55_RIDPI|nr:hypothetical protein NP493_573g00024 [Ridgeia piscesae]
MDVAQQRDIDIDRPRPSAQRWPRWQNLRGVFDNESLTQLLGAYRMESLLDSFTSEEPSVVFARKQPSDDKQWFDLQHRRGVSPHLLLYLQNHHPHASTSTNSVCFTRSMKFADINCPEQSRHIRSCTSPLLQQSSHHVKWLLPLAHQKMTKEAVTDRQNT